MRNFLLANCPLLIWCIVALELVIVVLFATNFKKTRRPYALCAAVLCFGLFYDALIIVLGSALQSSAAFETLSRLRFVSHGMLIPLLFPICAYALKSNKVVTGVVWVFTVALIVAGLAESLATQLEIQQLAGVIRYKSGEGTPAWAEAISRVLSFGTVIPLMLAGIWVWIKQKTPTVFLAGFLMFAFAALAPATGNMDLNFFISMFGELLMALFLYLYLLKKE